MNRFDKKNGDEDSSDENRNEEYGMLPKPKTETDVLKQKNQILMERLLKT